MEPDIAHQLIRPAAAGLILLLTGPGFVNFVKSRTWSGEGYIQLAQDTSRYQDCDGVATEDSIRAYSDTRPRVAVWITTIVGLGSSVAARVLALRKHGYEGFLSELAAEAEAACWVRFVLHYSSGVLELNVSLIYP